MTRSVRWVALASAAQMGQQIHEQALQRALRALAGDTWNFSERSVSGLRSGRKGVRVPLRLLERSPYAVAATAGRVAYGRADLVHRFDLRCPPRVGREVLTVHDLPPLRFDDEGRLPGWARRSARQALGVICPSRFAADEVEELLQPRRVWVVPNGVDLELVTNPPTDLDRRALQIEGRFVLHAGGATKRKNLDALALAWTQVAGAIPGSTLVLCGPPHPRRASLFGARADVRYLGHLPQRQVLTLMRAAAAVVVPSLYEGFGLPALEGLAAGVPVVAARTGALPEVCGAAALLVDPSSDALAAGLIAVLEDEDLADGLRAAGPQRAAEFTWERAARATLAVYEELIG